MKDVERVIQVGQTDREPASSLEFHPFAKPRAVVSDHRPKCREPGELLGPSCPVTRLDHPTGQPAQTFGLDDHQDGLASKKKNPWRSPVGARKEEKYTKGAECSLGDSALGE
jgi:hypothetical protein